MSGRASGGQGKGEGRVRSFPRQLKERVGKAKRLAVLGVGDELNPFDQLGVAAAERVRAQRLPGVRVFQAGVTPEAFTAPVRRSRPDHILVLDAADFGAPPGAVAVLRAGDVQATLFSTHSIPLPVVMEYMEQTCGAPATLIGLQPDFGPRGAGLTPAESRAAARVARAVAALTRARRRPPPGR